jgi:hypothetical protein
MFTLTRFKELLINIYLLEKPPLKALTINQIKPQKPSQKRVIYKTALPLLK